MFEPFNALRRSAAPLQKAARVGLLGLLLALCAGWVSPAAPARAAQSAQPGTPTRLRFYLNVDQPLTLCAGQVYPINVTPQVQAEVKETNEPPKTIIYTLPDAVQIKSEVSDTSIATIDPPSQTVTGLGPYRDLSDTHPATFNLHAKKAGTTFLYLTAEVPARYSGGAQKYFWTSAATTGYLLGDVKS